MDPRPPPRAAPAAAAPEGGQGVEAPRAGEKAVSISLYSLGYVEGQHVLLEVRWTDGASTRLPALVGGCIHLTVDVIVTYRTPSARAAKAATTTIPIVAIHIANMLRVGLVDSLARPGGNVPRTSVLLPELGEKVLQWLTEMLPAPAVALLWYSLNPGAVLVAEAVQTTACEVGVQVSALDVRRLDEITAALATAANGRVGAVIVLPDPLLNAYRTRSPLIP